MILIPYVVYKNPTTNTILIKLFLENGGKQVIEVLNLEAAEDYLGENTFHLKSEIWREGTVLFAPIDSEKTELDGFYTWTELAANDTRECWRPFLILTKYIKPASIPTFGMYIQSILSRLDISIQ